MRVEHHVIRATVFSDIADERRRQVEVEGWTPEHDDEHRGGALADAAACYCLSAANESLGQAYLRSSPPKHWPWESGWWKPTNARADLVKAAALIVAEIERIDRARERAS